MSAHAIEISDPHTPVETNVTWAQQNDPVLHLTPELTTTSPTVDQGGSVLHLADDSAVTNDQPETSGDVTQGEDLCDVMHLSPKMHHALELLFAGHCAASVARQLGVHRHTIARWRTNHAAFIAAYNRHRAEAAEDLSRRIAGLLETALTNVERHIATIKKQPTPEQIRASLRLISTLGRSRRVFATGPTDPYTVLDQMIRHDRYLADSSVHAHIDDKTRASYINTYTMRLTDDAPDCDLPFSPETRMPKTKPRQLPTHPWEEKRKRAAKHREVS